MGGFKFEAQLPECLYREAVTSQSPGLLQPWGTAAFFIDHQSRQAYYASEFSHLNGHWFSAALD